MKSTRIILLPLFLRLLFLAAIFLAYIPLEHVDKIYPMSRDTYTLKTFNIEENNKPSTFREEKYRISKYFIHTGEQAPVGVFKFKDTYEISLDFWIKKGSSTGDIEFDIIKNDISIDKIVVKSNNKKQVSVFVDKDDEVKIIADKHGSTDGDWGQLQITEHQNKFVQMIKKVLIPLVWSLLFIFLLNKSYKYMAISSYLIFLTILFAEKLNFGSLSFANTLTYTIYIFALIFALIFIQQELQKFNKTKTVALILFTVLILTYIVPLFHVLYALNFDAKVNQDILFAIFQSNSNEAYEYLADNIALKYIFSLTIFTILIAFLAYGQAKQKTIYIEKTLLLFIIITFFGISITQFSQLKMPNFLFDSIATYKKELRLFKKVQAKRKSGKIPFEAKKTEKNETYIVIIGESLNKNHMGIYGYFRNTTPILSKLKKDNQLIIFNNVYSNHTHTAEVLSQALTESNQYNKKVYYESISIIEILKKAKIDNYWLTNQTIYGAYDNLTSVIATSSDNIVSMNKHIGKQAKSSKLDAALIDEVKKVLANKTNTARVLFVHLMGSHGAYPHRYPKEYDAFGKVLPLGEFGKKGIDNAYIGHYDNSILYNDYVVSSILKELQKEKGVAGLLYMSDHADDALGKLSHNSSNFTYEMTQIPFIIWLNDEYKDKYAKKFHKLKKNTETLFSNDMLYDTLIGLFDIKTDHYNPKYDLTSSRYSLVPKDAMTLHGKKHYTDKSNYSYWQNFNTSHLSVSTLSSKVFPCEVNTIGKLHDIWNDGLRSFHTNVRFNENTKEFHIAHKGRFTYLSLEKFITSIEYMQVKSLVIDIDNLTQENHKQALGRLEYLDKKYSIKRKTIIVSSTRKTFFSLLKQNDWHTSYSLANLKLIELVKNANTIKLTEFANQISKQVQMQNVSSISFDKYLYPFIKQYLESILPKKIAYNMYNVPSLWDNNFKEKLFKNKTYLDERVKVLFSEYYSEYNL